MNNSSQNLQATIKLVMNNLSLIRTNAEEVYARYWGTSAAANIAGLADGDACTVASKLKKSEFVSGLSLAEAIKKFFNNEVFAAAAHGNTCRLLILGDAVAAAVISNEVESLGNLMVYMANDCLETKKLIFNLLEFYSATELSAALGAMSSSTVMFGCDTTKSDLVLGLTCAEQFRKFLLNDSAVQGDYKNTLALWTGKN